MLLGVRVGVGVCVSVTVGVGVGQKASQVTVPQLFPDKTSSTKYVPKSLVVKPSTK